jgi:uncharacterized membrane protein YphA (DoxX/SURF4 family)
MSWRYVIGVAGCVILGVILIFAGIGKLFAGLPSQVEFLSQLTPLFAINEDVAMAIAYVLPWAEICIGMTLLLQLWVSIVVMVACVPLTMCFAVNNVWMMGNGKAYDTCNSCFGIFEQFISLTPWQAFMFDLGMLAVCCVILFINQNYPVLYGVFGESKKVS